MVDQTTIWNWVLVGMTDRRAGERGQEDLDFLNYRMKAAYTEPFKDLHTYYAMASCRYKEQVEVYEKLCARIAKEHGGEVLSEEEFQYHPSLCKTRGGYGGRLQLWRSKRKLNTCGPSEVRDKRIAGISRDGWMI
jgi:hypothetical protein